MTTPANSKAKVHIRWMIRRDMAEVLDIERSAFDFPWLEEDFIRCLRQRNCIGMVAEYDMKAVGFAIYELHKTRLEILNLAVRDGDRLRGVGSLLISKLKSKLSEQRRRTITADVWDANTGAQLFLRSQGFLCTSIIEGYCKELPDAEGYRFECWFDEAECEQAKALFRPLVW